MLQLGFGDRSRSAGAIRIVRRRADELNLDWSHFRGKRRWSDDDLRRAVATCHSWEELVTRLGLSTASGNVQPHIKSHTVRLGLDTDHLNAVSHVGRQPPEAVPQISALRMERKHLRVAAPVYDLLVDAPEGLMRVQVKSTTSKQKDHGWIVGVGHHPDTHSKKGYLLAYSPDEIDLFFIVDGDMTMYLIPSRAIAGRVGILLRTYAKYTVGNASGLLGLPPDAGEPKAQTSALDHGTGLKGCPVTSSAVISGGPLEGALMADIDVEDWLSDVGLALGVPVPEVLTEELQEELLGLTGEIAHNVVRVAVPWTSYLIGVAVGRGASPAEALRMVKALLPETPGNG
jgi:Domain of unknown function (DUF6457)